MPNVGRARREGRLDAELGYGAAPETNRPRWGYPTAQVLKS
jgi:hypothetical protein